MKAKQVRAPMRATTCWALVANHDGVVCGVYHQRGAANLARRAYDAEHIWRLQKVRVVPVTAEDR